MADIATAQRVSAEISDNYVYQRSRLAYYYACKLISGDVLEIGTGTGYGIEMLSTSANRLISIDKEQSPLLKQFANVEYVQAKVPPIPFESNSFDYQVSFQLIEHINRDIDLVREMARTLRPGGKLILTTPNSPMSLTRNPWHVREYDADSLKNLLGCAFSSVELFGVIGNNKVMMYYEKNKYNVAQWAKLDIFDLQHRLPAWLLRKPYDWLNRFNRRRLHSSNKTLTESIQMEDYTVVPYSADLQCFDLLAIATK